MWPSAHNQGSNTNNNSDIVSNHEKSFASPSSNGQGMSFHRRSMENLDLSANNNLNGLAQI